MAGSKAIAVQKPWTAIFLHLTAIADGYTAEMPIVSGFVVPKINLSAFFINRFIDLTDMLLHLRSHPLILFVEHEVLVDVLQLVTPNL